MDDRIRWARKVNPAKIRKLYQTDALGMVDEELIDEVGMALYARCQSILLVSGRQVKCPRCGHILTVNTREPEQGVVCSADGCAWQTTVEQWHKSWRHQDLIGTRAASAFESYIERYERARHPREKMLLIDQLLHAFHHGIIADKPHRAAANNLIEGSHGQVIAFLDELTYGPASTPGLADQQVAWREGVKDVGQVRRGNL